MFQSENIAHSTKRHHHEEDDEEECRVCRGPAEEGYVRMDCMNVEFDSFVSREREPFFVDLTNFLS